MIFDVSCFMLQLATKVGEVKKYENFKNPIFVIYDLWNLEK